MNSEWLSDDELTGLSRALDENDGDLIGYGEVLQLAFDELLAHRAARQPGMVTVQQSDLRALVEFVHSMGCPETGCEGCPVCPCYPAHKSCRTALLAHFDLAEPKGGERRG